MGFIRKLTGQDAAERGAAIQAQSADRAIDMLREEMGIARQDLQPFVDVGASSLEDLTDFNKFEQQQAFVEQDPAYQGIRDFQARTGAQDNVLNFNPMADNPIYDGAVSEAMRRTEERRAAGGKLGSGGTLVDLTNATAMTRDAMANSQFSRRLGQASTEVGANAQEFQRLLDAARVRSGLATDQYNRLLSTAGLAQASAAGQAANQQALGSNVASLTTGKGDALAAGLIGGVNARNSFFMDIAKLGSQFIPKPGG